MITVVIKVYFFLLTQLMLSYYIVVTFFIGIHQIQLSQSFL